MVNNKLKKINIKNRTCYYLHDLRKINDLDFKNIAVDEKSDIDIYIYYLRYKIPYSTNNLSIIFIKTNACIKDFYGLKYLTLLPTDEKDKGVLI